MCVLVIVVTCAGFESPKTARAQSPTQSPSQSPTQRVTQQASQLAKVRFRVSWGGGQNQSWQGSIASDSATVSDIAPLGLNETSAGTATITDDRKILIHQTTASNYDGFDFTFTGNLDALFQITLSANDGPESTLQKTVTARSLIQGTLNEQLDDMGNRLTIERSPGDVISVQLNQDHLVVPASSLLPIGVSLNHSDLKQNQTNLRISVVPARQEGPALWSQSTPLKTDQAGNSTTAPRFEIETPSVEGVYDLLIEVEKNWLGIKNANKNSAIRALTPQNNTLTRRVQFVVLADQVADQSATGDFETIAQITPETISPNGPNWRLVSHKHKSSVLGNNKSQLVQSDQRSWVELGTGGWQAIRLPTVRPGMPQIVEIEYPSDRPISLGISVLDPSQQGQVALEGADSGIHIPQSVAVGNHLTAQGRPTGVHRITYWPQSSSPYLLLANQSTGSPAQFGTIRVLAGPDRLPSGDKYLPTTSWQRKRMAWHESPSFMDDFGVQRFYDPVVKQSLDDWVTFYEGTSRLISYLKANHYQGAVITVTDNGSSIYPAAASVNTPLHDTGVFLTEGQDPIRKDVLRMMLKMFERENLTLVPAFAFSHPLPEIENLRDAAQSPQSFELVDASNTVAVPSEKLAIYNPLDDNVQQAVVRTLQQFVQRYRGFESLGGITLLCKPNTYTLLNGAKWGHDPITVKRFADATAQQTPDPNETANQGHVDSQWVQWRAAQMTRWYQQIADLVDNNIPGGHLFIAPSGMYHADEAFSALCPNLHASTDFEQLMKRYGFDRSKLLGDPRIVLLNAQSLATSDTLSASRVEINANESREVNAFFSGGAQRGTLFEHQGMWAHFAQLQKQHPFNGQSGRLMRRLQLTPAGHWNRKRFISAIRQQDSFYLFDGGRGLAQGQEHALENLATTFNRLPRVAFSDVRFQQENQPAEPTSTGSSQSVIVRQARFQGDSYVYAINDSPWETTVTVAFGDAGQGDTGQGTNDQETKPLTPNTEISYLPLGNQDQRQQFDEGLNRLTIQLPPHSMAGGKHAGTKFAAKRYRYVVNDNVGPLLRKKTYSLQAKLNLAKDSAPLNALANPDFESLLTPEGVSWDLGDQSPERVAVDQQQGYQSNSSLKLTSDGTPTWIRSNRFSVPTTGRLSVVAYLRIDDPTRQPPLRIAIEGETQSSTYYRFGAVGSLAPETETKQIGPQWQRFAVHFDDLPTGQLRDLRIGFDLMGEGTVWIDSVSVYDRWFDENDAKAITQLLAGAAPLLDQPTSYESCRRILESYWPRFLDEYIGVDPSPLASDKPIADSDSNDRFDESLDDHNSDNIFKRVKSGSPSLLRRWRSN